MVGESFKLQALDLSFATSFTYLLFAVDEPYFSLHDKDYFPLPNDPSQRTDYEPKYMEVLKKWYGTKDTDKATWREIIPAQERIVELMTRLSFVEQDT